MSADIQVTASEVQEGDFLPGLDNGYVFQEPETDHDLRDGRYNTAVGRGLALISFHDQNGDECYLLAPPDMTVTVTR
jgi:hypothetical protein